MKRVVRAFEQHGARVVTFNFPYMDAGRSAPDRAPVLEAHFAAVWKDAVAGATGPLIAAGKSMGGRIASQVAASGGFDPAPSGLVFFGYPLHPPAKPAQRRDKHLPQITAPMLFLHGTRDPFGSPDEMRALVTVPAARDARDRGRRRSFAGRHEDARPEGRVRREGRGDRDDVGAIGSRPAEPASVTAVR